MIEANRERFEFIDIACLASAEDVRNGKVPIILSHGDNSRPLYYTVETYILHLKNILHILDTCESYHFVPVDARMQKEGTLMVKEGHKALLVRLPPPPDSSTTSAGQPSSSPKIGDAISVFEISQPAIVQLCQEHLFRIADQVGYTGVHRAQIFSQIKQKIRELQN